MKFTVQRHRFSQRLRTNNKTTECSPPPTSHHHIAKDLFITVTFSWYIMSSYQEKITRHTEKQKTQFKETEQASKPDMAEMLKLSH